MFRSIRGVSPVMCALVAAPFLAFAASTAEWRVGPGDSPLSWSPAPEGEGLVVMPNVIAYANGIVDGRGGQPSSKERVTIHDQHSFGVPGDRSVWLLSYDSVKVALPTGADGETVYVEVSVAVDAETQKVLLAFTSPLAQWTQRTMAEKNPEEEARKNGWSASWLEGDSLVSTIPKVLGELWYRSGVNPSAAGQIILRPRHVSNKWPAKRVGTSLVPVLDRQDIWIVQVLGAQVLRKELPGKVLYYTGLLAQVADQGVRFLRGIPLP